MLPLTQTLIFLVLGAFFGFTGGLFGIGGGIVAIPILGIFFGQSEQVAQGTALVMVVPNALVGLWRYLIAVKIDWRLVAAIAVAAFPVTLVASRIATLMPSRTLRLAFVVFIVVLSGYIAWRAALLGRSEPRAALPWPFGLLLGTMTGALSGLFTIGGAIFAVPVLSTYFGCTQLMAQATALALTTPGILLSLGVYAFASDIDWAIGIPLAVGGVFAVPFGVNVARGLPDRSLRFAFCGFLLVCAVGLYVRTRIAG